MEILFIINIYSGRGKAKQEVVALLDFLSNQGIYPRIFFTQVDVQKTFDAITKNTDVDLVICLGGDGTLNDTLNGLMQVDENTRPVLGYIPMGTTNDFARTLSLNNKPLDALEQIIGGEAEKIDIGNANGQFFSYIASFGVFTSASYDTPQSLKNIFGHLAYVLSGAKELASIEEYNVKIQTDTETLDGKYVFGAISNATSIGGMLNLDEKLVNLQDGLFEIVLVKPPKNINDLRLLVEALTTQTKANDFIEIHQAKKVTLHFEKEVALTLDGEKSEESDVFIIDNWKKELVLNRTK